jgi:hypothetical protein
LQQRSEETGEDKLTSVCVQVENAGNPYCEREGITEERIQSIITSESDECQGQKN